MSELDNDLAIGRVCAQEAPVRDASLSQLKSYPVLRLENRVLSEASAVAQKPAVLKRVLDNWEGAVFLGSFTGTLIGGTLAGGNILWPMAQIPQEQVDLGIKIWAGTIALSAPGYLVMAARHFYIKMSISLHPHG